MEDQKTTVNKSRRKFIQKAVYVAPAVMTLSAMPFTASYGSQQVSRINSQDHRSTRGDQYTWDKPYKKWNKSNRRDK